MFMIVGVYLFKFRFPFEFYIGGYMVQNDLLEVGLRSDPAKHGSFASVGTDRKQVSPPRVIRV